MNCRASRTACKGAASTCRGLQKTRASLSSPRKSAMLTNKNSHQKQLSSHASTGGGGTQGPFSHSSTSRNRHRRGRYWWAHPPKTAWSRLGRRTLVRHCTRRSVSHSKRRLREIRRVMSPWFLLSRRGVRPPLLWEKGVPETNRMPKAEPYVCVVSIRGKRERRSFPPNTQIRHNHHQCR